MNIEALQSILKRRGIQRVKYFHTDHFEPWGKSINDETAKAVENFAKLSRTSKFSARMNLFYHAYLPYQLDAKLAASTSGEVDSVVFPERTPAQVRLAKQVMSGIESEYGHEVHLHIHHEGWTRNTGNYSKEISGWINAHSTAQLDESRFRRGLEQSLRHTEEDIGRKLTNWAFVHGNWALNGSDRSICWIDNEMQLLMEQGCFGDFTFPAGRGHCDPVMLEEPYTCLPVVHAKAYDTDLAAPSPVRARQHAPSSERFFIWNSAIKASYSSLDYYYEPNRERFRNPAAMVNEWLSKSVEMDGCLYIKTHAHSMWSQYMLHEPHGFTPHLNPELVQVFDLLEKVCDGAGVGIEVVTVSELMQDFQLPVGAAGAETSAPTTSVVPAAPTVAVVTQQLGVALRAWLDGSEERDKAAGDFYKVRVNAGTWLEDYEKAIIGHLLSHYPPSTTKVTEVGAGLGCLTLTLAALGYEVCAFEGDKRRSDGANWLRTNLAGLYPDIARRYSIIEGFYPDAFPKGLVDERKKNVLVSTNLIHSFSAQNQDRILRSALQFDRFIFDASRFGLGRKDGLETGSLVSAMSGHFRLGAEVWSRAGVTISEFSPLSALEVLISEASLRVPAKAVLSCAMPVVQDWLKELQASGGRDAFFADKLARGELLDRREISVAAQMLRLFDPATTRIVEIGSACGALALLLAANGFDVVGIDGGVRRTAAATLVRQRWIEQNPDKPINLSFRGELFAKGFSGDLLAQDRKNVLLATNIVGTYSAEHQDEMLRAAAGFDDVVLDLGRFGVNRDQTDERAQLLSAMAGTFFVPQRMVFSAPPNEFWHFRSRPILA
jgi:hypothetical protein